MLQTESDRVSSLLKCDILDTGRDTDYDRFVFMTAQIFKVPIVAVSLVDTDRQWFKAQVGMAVSQTPRVVSFCTHTIQQEHLMEVPDTRCDQRFATSPLVLSSPFIRFYAGVPLLGPDCMRIGALCIMDRSARSLSKDQRILLTSLAAQVSALIASRTNPLAS
jgi:GAF domain-containing protein